LAVWEFELRALCLLGSLPLELCLQPSLLFSLRICPGRSEPQSSYLHFPHRCAPPHSASLLVKMRSHFCMGWPQTMVLPISCSQGVRIIFDSYNMSGT
jgi:hypothetical protein